MCCSGSDTYDLATHSGFLSKAMDSCQSYAAEPVGPAWLEEELATDSKRCTDSNHVAPKQTDGEQSEVDATPTEQQPAT